MSVSFLLDENMEPQVGERLEAVGHSVEAVEEVPELGPGATDEEIVTYSKQHERVILTFDDDFVTDFETDAYHCVVYFADESLSGSQVSDIVRAMAEAYPASAFRGREFGSKAWL